MHVLGTIGFVIVALMCLGVGSCIYNVRQAAKADYEYKLQNLNGQELVIKTVRGDFRFDMKDVKSIEVTK